MMIAYPLDNTRYFAEDASTWLCTRTTGVYSSDRHFIVTAIGGMNLEVSSGLAWANLKEFNGVSVCNRTPESVEVPTADGVNPKVCRVVIRIDKIINQAILKVVDGVPAANPQPPELQRDANAYEIGIATVRVKAGALNILQSDITSTLLDEKVCGVMRDGVTGIPTQTLYDDWVAWFNTFKLSAENQAIELTSWINAFKTDNSQDFTDWLNNFKTDSTDEVQGLVDQLRDLIDGDAAGQLLNAINAHENKSVNTPEGVHQIRQQGGFIQTYRDNQWSAVGASYAPANVTGLISSPAPTSVSIMWGEPDDVTIGGIPLSKWEKSIVVFRTDRYPTSETDGTVILTNTERNKYKNVPFIHSGLAEDTQYYYHIYLFSDGNVINRDVHNRTKEKTQANVPGNVTALKAVAGYKTISVTWSDPPDYSGMTWRNSRVQYKEGGYPAHESDGITAKVVTVRDQHKTAPLEITGLKEGTKYYIQIFPSSTTGTFNRDPANRVEATTTVLPPEPTSYEYLTGFLANGTWVVPEDGKYKVHCIGKSGNGGGRAIASSGGGGSGGVAISILELKKGESYSITVSGVLSSFGSSLSATAGTNGVAGSANITNKTPGGGGGGGTAVGGNVFNSSGYSGGTGGASSSFVGGSGVQGSNGAGDPKGMSGGKISGAAQIWNSNYTYYPGGGGGGGAGLGGKAHCKYIYQGDMAALFAGGGGIWINGIAVFGDNAYAYPAITQPSSAMILFGGGGGAGGTITNYAFGSWSNNGYAGGESLGSPGAVIIEKGVYV